MSDMIDQNLIIDEGMNELGKIFIKNNRGEFSMLVALSMTSGELSSGELASTLGLTKARISAMTKSLASKGLVQIKDDPKDKRITLVSITDEGMKTIQQAKEKAIRVHNRLIEKFGKENVDLYISMSIYINTLLKEECPNA